MQLRASYHIGGSIYMTTAAAAALASAKDARERYDVYASARLLGCSFQAQMVDAGDIEEIDPS